MNTNKMANMGINEMLDSTMTITQHVQDDPERNLLGLALCLRLMEDLGVVDIADLLTTAENAMVDINATECENLHALQMYITHELKGN